MDCQDLGDMLHIMHLPRGVTINCEYYPLFPFMVLLSLLIYVSIMIIMATVINIIVSFVYYY